MQYIPLSFARLNGLNKINSKKIYLQNEKGRSWKLALKHHFSFKSGMQTFVQSGWRRFCSENGISRGQYTFKLVRKSAPPVIRLCRAKTRQKQRSVAESSSDHSCFDGSVTPSSLRNDQLVSTNFVFYATKCFFLICLLICKVCLEMCLMWRFCSIFQGAF